MNEYDLKEFLQRFKLVCRKCGSDKAVMSRTGPGLRDREYMGYTDGALKAAYVTAGCNACKQNDYRARV